MHTHRDNSTPPCRLAFAHLVRRPDASIDLAEASLLIAKEEYPELDIASYLARLDRLADDVRGLASAGSDPHRLIAGLSEYLFQRLGFRGNAEDYYDPKNSFLNDVLDRRLGIPITLSTVYLEVGRRLGLSFRGVGMPGHFLVKYLGRGEEIVIDPFGGGAIVSPCDCQRILDRIYDGKIRFEPGMLSTVGTRQILARMLANLKAIYFNNEEYGKALSAVEHLLILHPHEASEIRDRGLLACQLRRYAEAMSDLERYLRLAPEANDSATIREHLCALRKRAAALN